MNEHKVYPTERIVMFSLAVALIVFLFAPRAAQAFQVDTVQNFGTTLAQKITGIPLDGDYWTGTWEAGADTITENFSADTINDLVNAVEQELDSANALEVTNGQIVAGQYQNSNGFIIDTAEYSETAYGPNGPNIINYNISNGDTAAWNNTGLGAAWGGYVLQLADEGPQLAPVPEPSTVILLGLGLICLAGLLRKGKRQIHLT